MSLRRILGCWARALCVALAVMLAAPAAGAIEPPSGSKNFTPPGSVPDYFSNESGPFRGAGGAVAAPPSAAPVVAAPAPHPAVAARRHVRRHLVSAAKARGHRRLVGRRAAVHGHAIHNLRARAGKPPHALARRHPVNVARGKSVAAKRSGAPAKGKRLARASG